MKCPECNRRMESQPDLSWFCGYCESLWIPKPAPATEPGGRGRRMDKDIVLKNIEALNAEMERLHKLIDQGKEVAWATTQVDRLIKVQFAPAYIQVDTGIDPGKAFR